MNNSRKIYDEGLEYFHNAVSFSKSNKFGENITINVITLAAEYLMSSMLYKNGMEPYGHGLENIIATLEKNELIPAEIKAQADELQTKCSCVVSADSATQDIELMITSLRTIKNWVDSAFKPEYTL